MYWLNVTVGAVVFALAVLAALVTWALLTRDRRRLLAALLVTVVFTDRSLNHMSAAFQEVMRDISATLTKVYAADCMAIVPGGGTFGMEAVARQLGTGKNCLVLRNGWFSYRCRGPRPRSSFPV